MTIRRLFRDVSSVLIIAGLLMVLDAGLTLVWQEPVTAAIGLFRRDEINQSYLNAKALRLSTADRAAISGLASFNDRIGFLARREESEVPTGAAIGRLDIPKLGVEFDVIEGTDTVSLEKGPGHYPSTAFPGMDETVAIAGHRTTYLAPFRNLNLLGPGDTINMRMPYGTFVYKVQYDKIVTPSSWWITDNVGYDRLVLSACNPLYSASQRIVVFARLERVDPNFDLLTSV